MSKFIDNISVENGIPNGLTIEDLYAYSQSLLCEYIRNRDNVRDLKCAIKLSKKIIEINESQRAYENYIFILINSGQYDKAFKVCKELLKNIKYYKFALKCLSDGAFYDNGFVNEEERLEILNKRLELTESDNEKSYILHLIDNME